MSHLIHIEPSGHQLHAEADESVLDAALRQGLALPYGCRNGACRSCKGRVLEGEVHYPGGVPKSLTSLDAAQGFALLCTAHATSNLRIEVEEIDSEHDIVVRNLPCRVMQKRELAHDVIGLELMLPASERLQYLPGQYVDVLLRDGRRRAFSVANAARDDDRLELQIRRVPGGTFSEYVFHHLKERALLRLRGPLGSFYLRKQDHRPVILMAGGTGFAPIKAIVEGALADGFPGKMHLYWGVRGRRDLYMHDLASAWAAEHDGLEYTPVLSEPLPNEKWSGRRGFVHEALLEDFADLSPFSVYLSGPPIMVAAGRESFIARGLDAARFHSDSFDYAYETGHDVA
ncbi:MAG: 2Fe-2S iron-sulfur cluster binding domain-containing protein [Proteobacteria bacterium]|nr:2Fe-2S iron-sulfur cluster binding domain-containing protein [Pseudomonadota bacterium]